VSKRESKLNALILARVDSNLDIDREVVTYVTFADTRHTGDSVASVVDAVVVTNFAHKFRILKIGSPSGTLLVNFRIERVISGTSP
jgi:hypothetical protein